MKQRKTAPERAEALLSGLVDIGAAAEASGVSVKMIRHYEMIGLLPDVPRTSANYRLYTDKHIHYLQFIRRARSLGFSMDEIRELLSLWQNRQRRSASVKRIATEHIDGLRQRMEEIQGMLGTLQHLVNSCKGDERPDCPILKDLAA